MMNLRNFKKKILQTLFLSLSLTSCEKIEQTFLIVLKQQICMTRDFCVCKKKVERRKGCILMNYILPQVECDKFQHLL